MAAKKKAAAKKQPVDEQVPAEWVDISSLKIWKKNPRKISDDAVAFLAEGIKRFGFTNPVLVRRANNEVAAGHTRLRAVALLTAQWARASTEERKDWHIEAVFIVQVQKVLVRFRDLTERESHLLAIADNKLAERTDWDEAQLASVVADLSAESFAGTGFDAKEIAALLKVPNFGEGDGAPRLDQLDKSKWSKVVKCPKCQHEFKA